MMGEIISKYYLGRCKKKSFWKMQSIKENIFFLVFLTFEKSQKKIVFNLNGGKKYYRNRLWLTILISILIDTAFLTQSNVGIITSTSTFNWTTRNHKVAPLYIPAAIYSKSHTRNWFTQLARDWYSKERGSCLVLRKWRRLKKVH